ncbi:MULTISPECIES: response regulator transcription factor [unclassified Cupriavidus]|uniref:response regulator transcription factor n=1 Tax=Cupriavidus sp. H19C3 TaxID=3241603 RepID=UPI003BF8F601
MRGRLNIALLEDDVVQSNLITRWLNSANHEVASFGTGRDFIRALQSDKFDALILDWILPDLSGLDVLAWARLRHHRSTPVIFLTQKNEGRDVATALRCGADDFVRKPVDRDELLARVESATRRHVTDARTRITIGKFTLDRGACQARRGDDEIHLTSTEFALAWELFQNAGQIVSRERLHVAVWGRHHGVQSRTLDAHISNLRMRFGLRAENGLRVVSLYNHGYRLDARQGCAATEDA